MKWYTKAVFHHYADFKGCARRKEYSLHDVNKSAYQLFWGLLPIIGWIVLIVFTVRKGDTGDNPYGADPLVAPVST